MSFGSYIGTTMSNDASILYAVLAISSRHRELTAGDIGHRSNEYERRCLEELIPSLNSTGRVFGESALASAVLLRLLEEMTGMIHSFVTQEETTNMYEFRATGAPSRKFASSLNADSDSNQARERPELPFQRCSHDCGSPPGDICSQHDESAGSTGGGPLQH